MHYKAGYISDSISSIITRYKENLDSNDTRQLNQINGLLKHVSSFDVQFPFKHSLDFNKLNPVLATLNNIITRGLPTRAPVIIEKTFHEIGLIEDNNNEFALDYPNTKTPINFNTVFELLHIIEPHLEISKSNYGGSLGSNLEWKFIRSHPFLKQILESQRDFSTISNKLQGNRSVDFSFTSPYLHWNDREQRFENMSRIFEVDGPHHSSPSYAFYDAYRDAISEHENFETIRFTQDTISRNETNYDTLIERKLYRNFKKNFNRKREDYLKGYSLIFIPLAVARVQKTIIEIFLAKPHLFNNEKLTIAIIERDLPCGALAIKSLKELFSNINAILEDNDQLHLPEIELVVFENKKWVINRKLHLNVRIENETFFVENNFDIVIDHSILRRSNIFKESDFQNSIAIKIRSSHYNSNSFGQSRRVYCADLLRYKTLVKKENDGSYLPKEKYKKQINYFIQTIFRKKSFRPGQLPIISRALQQKPVIGLLPTGGGKSLTYQLPTLLQPGLCLVVDPIKSLMEDQVRVLKENWIDCCEYINSNLNTEKKSKRIIDFRYGETMFLFISPERFVMQDFRQIISKIDLSVFGLAFSYCVIDEVHCVSEWGHDFRSTYLMLGKNAQKFSSVKHHKNKISLIGLTATASFDVLADIERELRIQHNDVSEAIIMIENTIRPELFFRVIDVSGKDRIEELNRDFLKSGKNLQRLNSNQLLEKSQRHHFNEFDRRDFATKETKKISDQNKIQFEYDPKYLIEKDLANKTNNDFFSIFFCPVKGTKRNINGNIINKQGVDYVYENLESDSKGYYYASDNEKQNQEIQGHFKKFTTDKTMHMVCTKAFGMGIDKSDIRSTYHHQYSNSLESLVQECGRAGRDRKIAEATILVSKNKYYKVDIFKLFRECLNNELIQDKNIRKSIRQAFHKKWSNDSKTFKNITFSNIEELLLRIDNTDFSLISYAGNVYNQQSIENINKLRSLLKYTDEHNNYQFINEIYCDRETYNFFHSLSFKGVDNEKSQIVNLFKIKEFQIVHDEFIPIPGQESLAKTFNDCKTNTFKFIISKDKIHRNTGQQICKLLNISPKQKISEYGKKTYGESIEKNIKYSNDFNDFLFLIEEESIISNVSDLAQSTKEKLFFIYCRDREEGDTGRLLYRMHSIGLLEDYIIDYKLNNLYTCTFKKLSSIGDYVKKIKKYLEQYLSENSASTKIELLEKRFKNSDLVEDILECLYFLAEFSYSEIAGKRKRATDEIENILNESITNTKYINDSYEQNIFIKEQIYFYFNAKYARIGFKIKGSPYSLLDDYKETILFKEVILNKYLQVFNLEGPEQNNYKHMIGACKKILRSLTETDLNSDWILRLLKAFSMYSVNNESYISEANLDLENGFTILYNDESYHQNNFDIIKEIFDDYFEKLQNNIQTDNVCFRDIKLIRAKLY